MTAADYQVNTAAPGDDPLFRTLYPPSGPVLQPLAGDGSPDDPMMALPREEEHVIADPDLRVSNDRTLAIIGVGGHAQEAYATQAVITRAVTRLRAAGSGVSLATDGASLTVRTGEGPVTLLRVRPVFEGGRLPVEICRDFSASVLGGAHSYTVFRDPTTGVTAPVRMNAEDEMELTGTHLLAEAMATAATDPAEAAGAGPEWAARQMGRDPRTKGGRPPWFLPGEAYGGALRLDGPDPDRLRAVTDVARRIGVNQFAWAAVGEGYVVQSIGSPDASGGFGLDVNHAKPGDTRYSMPFGYHFASVVLESEDGSSQVTLENFARRRHIQTSIYSAIEEGLRAHGPQLEDLLGQVEQRIAASPADQDPPRRLEGMRRYIDALIRVRDGRAEVSRLEAAQPPGSDPSEELAMARRTVDMAEKSAGLHIIQLPPTMDARRWWHMKMYSRRPGETFHEYNASLLPDDPDATSAVFDPLTLVVLGQETPAPRDLEFTEGDKDLDGTASYRVAGATREVARLSLWNEEYGLRPPVVTLTGYGNGTRIPGFDRARRARETAGERVAVTAAEFERVLNESLGRLLSEPPSDERSRALVELQREAAGLDLPAGDPGTEPGAARRVLAARRRRVTLNVDAGRDPGTSGSVPPSAVFAAPGAWEPPAPPTPPVVPPWNGGSPTGPATPVDGWPEPSTDDRDFSLALWEGLRAAAPAMIWADGVAESLGFGWLVAEDVQGALAAWARDQLQVISTAYGTSLPEGDDLVSLDELDAVGVALTSGVRAQAVLMGGRLTVEEAALNDAQRIDVLLNRASSRAYADTLAALVAEGLALGIEIVGPGSERRAFGPRSGDPLRIRFDGATYTVQLPDPVQEE